MCVVFQDFWYSMHLVLSTGRNASSIPIWGQKFLLWPLFSSQDAPLLLSICTITSPGWHMFPVNYKSMKMSLSKTISRFSRDGEINEGKQLGGSQAVQLWVWWSQFRAAPCKYTETAIFYGLVKHGHVQVRFKILICSFLDFNSSYEN